jgi:mannose/cellobiose epimerase-like protein (N-acyl-D-glucosamine 2-epimerase family)
VELPETYSHTIENLIGFFDDNGFDPDDLVYYSEIDNEGKITSDKIYMVALSRLIYGLSYTSVYYPENLEKAENLVNFLLRNLIGADSTGEYFTSFIEGDTTASSANLDVWQQAYGLCGLTEFYRNSPNEELLSRIHQLFDAFVMRFHDPENGGFWGNYNIETGGVSGSKSLQSLMYPVTAFMGNLWLADSLNRGKYEPYIKDNLEILNRAGWNTETNWVNIKFGDDWSVCESPDKSKPCFKVSPGHNFQLGALFLRTSSWTFLNQETKIIYQAKGKEIINSTLHKPIFGNSSIGNGFISQVNPLTDEVLDDRRTWWQHAEAIIALSLWKDSFAEELEQLKAFYFKSFQDHQNGGEFFYLDATNHPITSEMKGSMGKSTYHTIEMIRFLMEN